MRRTVLVALLPLAPLAAAACGLAMTGTGREPPGTGTEAADAALVADDGGVPEAPDADTEAGTVPDAACDGPVLLDAGVLAIPTLAAVPTVDGNLDDWGCVPFVTLDKSSAAYAMTSLTSPSGSFAIARAGADLYIAAKIADPDVGGTNTTEPYWNDSIEIYLDGSGALAGTYGTYDHQYVVDHKLFIKDYGPATAVVPPLTEIYAGVQKPAGGWSVEVKIALAALGITASPGGKRIGFDIDFTEGSGSSQDQMIYWFMGPGTPTGTCPGGEWCCGSTSVPWCDTKRFGYAQFAP